MSAPASFEKKRIRTVGLVTTALREVGVSPAETVLAAVSGGSDSTALLEILATLPRSDRPGLSVAYVDHGLDPARHRREADLVAAQAERLGLDFHRLCPDNPGRHDEASLRALRHAALQECAVQTECKWIATGHTIDDQIETVLFRLLRGSGRLGMGGISARRGRWIRPLLAIRRKELQQILLSSAITWSEDPSNDDPRYARNRIRRVLVPSIEAEIGAGGLARLARAAKRWREEDGLLEDLAAQNYAYAVRDGSIDLVALRDAPRPLRARVLRRWLSEVGIASAVELVHVEALEAIIGSSAGSSRIDLPGLTVCREHDRLTAHVPESPRPAPASVRSAAQAKRMP